MRWRAKAWRDKTKWHRTFVLFPKRIPSDRYVDGQWVWLEKIWRRGEWYNTWDSKIMFYEYSLDKPADEEAE